jgi:ComF family protein
MGKLFLTIKEFILDIIFPKFCFNCGKEGSYLCYDCFSLINIADRLYCPFCKRPKVVLDGKTCNSCRRIRKLNGLYCASSYNNFIIKKLISKFKYSPFVKELSEILSYLIIAHIIILNNSVFGKYSIFAKKDLNDFLIIPVPLFKKRLKWRGFNQSEEIAKHISKEFNIPLENNLLFKIKETPPQILFKEKEREENIKNVFLCSSIDKIKNKKIILIDDVFTTGSTMEECAKVLKKAGAKEVWGVVVARG